MVEWLEIATRAAVTQRVSRSWRQERWIGLSARRGSRRNVAGVLMEAMVANPPAGVNPSYLRAPSRASIRDKSSGLM